MSSTEDRSASAEPRAGSAGGWHDRDERGSAFIAVVMIMVIMTVVGLSFLIVADTENQISLADRDGKQVLYVAMTGAKIAESWFNVPDSAYNPFVPEKADCNLSLRVGDSDYDGTNDIDVPVNGNGQRYRGGTATGSYRLFDKPFRGAVRDTFWGSYAQPDVLISNTEGNANEYLDRMSAVFNRDRARSLDGVEILEIRVYAPPYDTQLQKRFGICTISVKAAKTLLRAGKRRRLTTREVTVVLQEMPFPVPGAAIESAADIDIHGNFGVHWGGSYCEGDMSLQSGSNFPGPGVPRENTSRYRFADFSPSAPDLDGNAGNGRQNLLTQLLAGPFSIPDPWANFRAAGHIVEAGGNNDDQPWPYDYTSGLSSDKSIFFQNQTYKFPELDYDFWKRFSQMRGRNANYFKFAGMDGSEPLYARNGVGATYSFAHWVNTENPGIEPGIYFFDTQNGQNPQHGGTGVLTPQMKVNSSVIDSPNGQFIMEGLIYSNSELIDSSGIAGHTAMRSVNMPGEPFLDTGIDIDRNGVIGNTPEELETIGNFVWDFAYDGSVESDGQSYDDVYGTPDFNAFELDHREPNGVLPDGGDDPRIDADTVHEPFLNLAYPAPGNPRDPCFVDYDYEATVQRSMGGDRDANGVVDRMTSLRDRKGALVNLDLIVNGVWYNEGEYDGSGNLPVYGSVLMKAGFHATGTPDIYFNEGLLLGDFPPPEMKIPRVYVSQVDTADTR
jgi:hypothetical protein